MPVDRRQFVEACTGLGLTLADALQQGTAFHTPPPLE
jgi:hypothetical protein